MTGAQAASVVLSAEEPPKSIFNVPAAASVNQFPRRRIGLELESNGRSAEIHHIASSSDAVTSTATGNTERVRYSFPLPGRNINDQFDSTSENPTSSTASGSSTTSTGTTSPPTSILQQQGRVSYATRISHIANPK